MNEGTKPGGFIAGFLFGCIGAILVQIFAKSQVTKTWAWYGFGAGIAISVLFYIVALVAAG